MSEREKNIIVKLAETVPALEREEQNYLLGVAEGMAIAKKGQIENLQQDMLQE